MFKEKFEKFKKELTSYLEKLRSDKHTKKKTIIIGGTICGFIAVLFIGRALLAAPAPQKYKSKQKPLEISSPTLVKGTDYETTTNPDQINSYVINEKKIEEKTKEDGTPYIPTRHSLEDGVSIWDINEKELEPNPIEQLKPKPKEQPAVEDNKTEEVVATVENNKTEEPVEAPEPIDYVSKAEKLNRYLAIADGYNVSYGSIATGLLTSLYEEKDVKKEEKIEKKDETFRILPGSSFIGDLLTPLTSTFPEVKPMIKFKTGDLRDWIGIGNISFKNLGMGVIIRIEKIVDPNGKEYSADGIAINTANGKFEPVFADKVRHFLPQKIGYSLLAALAGEAQGITKGQDPMGANFGTKTAGIAGGVLQQDFSEMASSYKSDVAVNPKSVLVVFY